MDAFEATVAKVLEASGFWVRPSYKVELTKADKVALGNPSMPRPEIDVLAYHPARNEVIAVECKSYFDSDGVNANDVLSSDAKYAERYKLFNREPLRAMVLQRLQEQLCAKGLCLPAPRVRLGMAVGHFKSDKDRATLNREFETRAWVLFTDQWLRERVVELAVAGYDNSVVVSVAKLLLRSG
jgi:hypothetical protein